MACSVLTPPAPALTECGVPVPRGGQPAVNGSAGFSDAADAYLCAQAVAWAKRSTASPAASAVGCSAPANDCTRAQIAAFLWRLYAEK